MRSRFAGFVLVGIAAAGIAAAGLLLARPTLAQNGSAGKAEKPSKPATAASAVSAASSEPATPHDLSGVWNMHPTAAQRKFINSTWSAEGPSMTAWEQARYDQTKPSNGPRTHNLQETDDPVLKSCLPPGTPRIYLQPFPMEIVQTPKETLIIYEYDHTVRRIFTDGRPHSPDLIPSYMGDSIGHWEGDTFVVDTIGLNDKTWLDRDGHGHSDQLHVIERFHRADQDNMLIDITMDDPKALAKPWVAQIDYQLKPDWDVLEQVCTDNAGFLGFEK
jgi:hypothetical protein